MSNKRNIQELLTRKERRLHKLKERQASYGIDTPPHILIEIEDIETEIEQLRAKLAKLQIPPAEENRLEEETKVNSEPPFSFTSWPPANILNTPRTVLKLQDTFPDRSLSFGPITLNEIALIHRPLSEKEAWKADSIAWHRSPTDFKLHQFWEQFEKSNSISPEGFDRSDQTVGKHIRLTAIGLPRHGEVHQINFLWQPISWEQSRRTNARITQGYFYKGYPIWCWFREKDLLPPPLESDDDRRDPPFANRFAINLVVIFETQSGRKAIVQRRSDDAVVSAGEIEIGVSESVHGNYGWSEEGESDIVDGNPDLLRTARRCLWQELGLAEKGMTYTTLPSFQFDVSFTALVLNKEELQARLVGFVIVNGDLNMLEESNRRSLEEKIVHKDFGSRTKVKDAVKWNRTHWVDATPSGLAWILKQTTLSPEERVRLVLYLEHHYGAQEAAESFGRNIVSANRPEWWPGSR